MSLESNLQVRNVSRLLDEDIEKVPNLADVGAGWPLGVAYGYCKGRLAIILHISLRRGEVEKQKFCATYYRSLEIVKNGLADRWSDEAELPADNMLHGQSEQLVLVRIIEVTDERKQGRQLWVPSVVRLRPLDSCLRSTAKFGEPSIPLGDEGLLAIGDRKLQNIGIGRGIRSAVPDGNTIHNMVESGAEIMNTIPSDQSPAFERGRLQDINANAMAATVEVALLGEDIRVSIHPRLKFRLECIEMFLGTTYLEEAASEFRTDHAVYRTNDPTGVSS